MIVHLWFSSSEMISEDRDRNLREETFNKEAGGIESPGISHSTGYLEWGSPTDMLEVVKDREEAYLTRGWITLTLLKWSKQLPESEKYSPSLLPKKSREKSQGPVVS